MLTLFFIATAYICFTFPPPKTTETIKVDSQRTISTEVNHGTKFYEWIGLLTLALSVWIWKKELKITGFGPFSGPPIEQQSPETFRREVAEEEKKASNMQTTFENVLADMRDDELQQQKKRILELARSRHALNDMIIAKDLRISRQSAKALLFLLTKKGKLRCDGYPKATLYTLTSSLENLAIDHIKTLIKEHHPILTERRFVRIRHKHELDAVFESDKETFLIEVKFLKNPIKIMLLEEWMTRFLAAANEFGDDKTLFCYLVMVALEGVSLTETQMLISQVSYDFGNKPLRIVVFDESELRKNQFGQTR